MTGADESSEQSRNSKRSLRDRQALTQQKINRDKVYSSCSNQKSYTMKKVDQVYDKILQNKDPLDKSSELISQMSSGTVDKYRPFQTTDSKTGPFRPS